MKYLLLLILLFSGCETYRVIDTPSGPLKAHIWVLYMYPPGDNQLWAWDRTGSKRVRAYIDNPEQIARQLIKQRITKAFYVEDQI